MRFNRQVDLDLDLSAELTEAAAYRFLGETYGLGADDVEITRLAVYPFEGGLAETFRVGNGFLAGDAAHMMPPFYGQGGCSALRDAMALAWRLDLVLRGLAAPALLDSYEVERRPDVRAHIESSVRLAEMVFVDDPDQAAARDRLYLSGRAPAPPPHPTLAAGVLHAGSEGGIVPPVGAVGPQGRVRFAGRVGRFDDVVGRGFQLIWRGGHPLAHLSAGERDFLARIGAVCAGISAERGGQDRDGVARDLDGAYGRFLDACGADGLLMRPDFIVFGLARAAGDLSRLVGDLEAQLAGGAPSGSASRAASPAS